MAIAIAAFAAAIAAAFPGPALAKWTEGILLLPSPGAKVDGKPLPSGALAGTEKVESVSSEARIFAAGPLGQALVVLAPGAAVTLSGSIQSGVGVDVIAGAVKIVAKPAGGSPVVSVTSGGKAVALPDPGSGGVVVAKGGAAAVAVALGSAEASALFPEGAPAVAKAMGMPSPGLPLIAAAKGSGGGDSGGSSVGGGAEVEGGSKCIDSSSSGAEGTNPGGDGNDPTQIDRTQTRVNVRVTW